MPGHPMRGSAVLFVKRADPSLHEQGVGHHFDERWAMVGEGCGERRVELTDRVDPAWFDPECTASENAATSENAPS